MHIVIVGLSHKTTPVEIREKVSFPENVLEDALNNLAKYPDIKESVILSTCNRVEIYAVVKDQEKGIQNIKDFICKFHNLNSADLDKCLYIHHKTKAIEHLFRVISSLESMVVGEPQIFGQIKTAYQSSFDNETTGLIFNTLFKNAITVGKKIRTDTDISKNAVSISFAAVELAKKIFDSIEGKSVMIIGVGKMSELTAKHLVNNGVTKVVVANRTYERAVEMAKTFNGTPIKFENINEAMVDIDIVISSTGAPHCIIDYDNAHKIIKSRKNRPIFFIDIAVPRDIDPKVNNIDNIYLYDIDDLKEVVNANIQERAKEIPKVEAIIEEEKTNFLNWYNSLDMVPTIVLLRKKIEEIRNKEFDKVSRKFNKLDENDINLINAMTKAIVNKILHNPMIKLKQIANDDDGYIYSSVVRDIFDLEDENEQSESKKYSDYELNDIKE